MLFALFDGWRLDVTKKSRARTKKMTNQVYTSPFGPVASQPTKEKMHTGHPLQFLFPKAQLSDWGRYPGASVGGSDALTDDFINKRLSSALALLILPHLTGRTGFQIIKHVIGYWASRAIHPFGHSPEPAGLICPRL